MRSSPKLGWRVTDAEYDPDIAGAAVLDLQNHYHSRDNIISELLAAITDQLR
jgi:hypothetical protein